MDATRQLHEVFRLDAGAEIDRIAREIREQLRTKLRRRGLVVAVSGGVDSAVCAALCVEAVGPERVLGLLLPERDSSPNSTRLGLLLAQHLEIEHALHDIAPTLEAIGCYTWRDDAIRAVFPEYEGGWTSKIAIGGGIQGRFNHFTLIVETPQGEVKKKRLEHREYLQIVAATNFKQRIRKTLEFFHADRLNYAVVGTPNRVEYDQGFFVKNGDGSADLKPIAHLYKTQVYALARHMNLPAEIASAVPTTDTYSMPQGQDEFYFGLPFDKMDLALWSHNHNKTPSQLARLIGTSPDHAELVLRDIDIKRRTTAPLHWAPLLVEPVPGPLTSPQSSRPRDRQTDDHQLGTSSSNEVETTP